MVCPICNQELTIPEHAERNMEAYRNVILVRSECCNELLKCFPIFTYTAIKYDGNKIEDDWGN